MKQLNYPLLRIVFSLIIGLVLVIWPDAASKYLVITIGVLFAIPGLIGTLGYFVANKNASRHFPIEFLGSLFFGLWLIATPGFFEKLLMSFLGVILVLGGIQQIYSVAIARRWTNTPFGFYILPALIFLSGVLILINPTEVRNIAFLIIGITCIVYAVTGLINWFRFTNRKPNVPVRRDRDIEDATIIED